MLESELVLRRGVVAGVVCGVVAGALLGMYRGGDAGLSSGGLIGDALVAGCAVGIVGALIGGFAGVIVGLLATTLLIAAGRLVHSDWQARLAAAASAALAGPPVWATMGVSWATLWFAGACGVLGLLVGRHVVFGGRIAP